MQATYNQRVGLGDKVLRIFCGLCEVAALGLKAVLPEAIHPNFETSTIDPAWPLGAFAR
jgi:hypothetical protein